MEQLARQLDDLAWLVAEVTEQDGRRPALEALVADLEGAVDRQLDGLADPVVGLGRRFARAHRLLVQSEVAQDGLLARLQHHAGQLTADDGSRQAVDRRIDLRQVDRARLSPVAAAAEQPVGVP